MEETEIPLEQDFDTLKPSDVHFRYGGKRYVLCEASEGDALQWREATFASARYKDGKLNGYVGLANTELLLVKLCIRELLFDASGAVSGEKQVTDPTLRTWKSRAVKWAFERVKEISDLNEGEPAERRALALALSRPNAPVTLDVLREYVLGLVQELPDVKPLADMLEAIDPAKGGAAKNAPSATGEPSS